MFRVPPPSTWPGVVFNHVRVNRLQPAAPESSGMDEDIKRWGEVVRFSGAKVD